MIKQLFISVSCGQVSNKIFQKKKFYMLFAMLNFMLNTLT